MVLSDIRMPGMTGPDLLSQMIARGIKTPIVFMSGHVEESLHKQVLAKGARGLLFKPFDFKEIVGYLKSA